MSVGMRNKGWLVTFSGLGINLALGMLYAWSVFKGAIETSVRAGDGVFTWDLSQLNDPYSLCCLMISFSMIFAGRCQDKWGPRLTACAGGILVGLGLFIISQSTSYAIWLLGLGVMVGSGIGFGYSAATPPALKWFPPAKTGLIAGLVVAGFGVAPVYIAPLSKYLITTYGLNTTMLIYAVSFVVVVCGLSTFLVNPPAGYVPEGTAAPQKNNAAPAAQLDVPASEVIRKPQFWMLWIIYFIGSGAGLMVISSIAGMAKKSMGSAAFVAVAIMAIGNAGGRIVAGVASDKLGRKTTLAGVLIFQAALMLIAIPMVGSQDTGAVLMVLLATFIGFNYGANLSVFPSITKDLWGLKSFGTNYGIMFTAWGVGGFVMSRVQQTLVAATGNNNASFIIAALMLGIGTVMTFIVKTTNEDDAASSKKAA